MSPQPCWGCGQPARFAVEIHTRNNGHRPLLLLACDGDHLLDVVDGLVADGRYAQRRVVVKVLTPAPPSAAATVFVADAISFLESGT